MTIFSSFQLRQTRVRNEFLRWKYKATATHCYIQQENGNSEYDVMKCSYIIWIMQFYVSSVRVRQQIKEGYHEDDLFHKTFQNFHITYITTAKQPRMYGPNAQHWVLLLHKEIEFENPIWQCYMTEKEKRNIRTIYILQIKHSRKQLRILGKRSEPCILLWKTVNCISHHKGNAEQQYIQVKGVFRTIAMPVLKNFTGVGSIHGAS